MEEYTIECSCCLKEVTVDNFYTIDLCVAGKHIVKSAIVEEICKDCLDLRDIFVPSRGKVFNYHIKNLEGYIEKRVENYLLVHFDLKREDCMTMKGCHDVLVSKGLLSDTYGKNSTRNKATISGDSVSRAKDLLKAKEKLNLIDLLSVPSALEDRWFQYLVERKRFLTLVDKLLRGSFTSSIKHTLTLDKTKELEALGWVIISEKNDEPLLYFFTDKKNKIKPCRYCGEVKKFDEFRTIRPNTSQVTKHHRCLACESSKAQGRYFNMAPEEKENFLKQVRDYRKNNPEKARVWDRRSKSKPEARAWANTRNRLKKFLKKAEDHYFSKGIGCTRKELVEHLRSQFKVGMSWDNYGSGEKGDHEGCWHIDHIVPISKFKGEHPNHYTNLQPLWGKENLSKSNKTNEGLESTEIR